MICFRAMLKLKIWNGVVLSLFVLALASIMTVSSQAQERLKPDDLIYTVQRGDTLILIALHYNLTLADLILANDLPNPTLVFPGQRLTLPGVSAPSEPILTELPPLKAEPHVVQAGESLSSIATQHNVPLGALVLVNNLANPDVIQAGQTLNIPEGPPIPEPLKPPFTQIALSEPAIVQGRTLVIEVTLSEPAGLTGAFEGRPLLFETAADNRMWSIVGIHALAEPDLYPISLTATGEDGTETRTFINVEVVEGPYGVETIQLDANRGRLLNEETIEQEREKLVALWSQRSPHPRWRGTFRYPIAGDSLRITSNFGTRRSYNGAPVMTFHGGTDFGGKVGLPIYAPAPGRVVLAEKLTLRGNAVLIDHGVGLFSGYWHQSRLAVEEGQEVQAGELLGYIGSTGLVTGPHLHWEMRLQGVAIDPRQWVEQTIP